MVNDKEIYDLTKDDLDQEDKTFVRITDVLDKPIVVEGWTTGVSEAFKIEYIRMTILMDDDVLYDVVSYSDVLKDQLERLDSEGKIPFKAMITKKYSNNGRSYYSFVPCDFYRE